MTEERKGELFIVIGGVLWSIFPIITALSLAGPAPLVSLGWTTLLAALFFAALMARRRRWSEIKNRKALGYMVWISLFIGLLYGFLFFGLKFTSPGNASLIGLTEVFYSFFLFNVWHKHYFAPRYILGAILTLIGAAIVLLPNVHAFNPGDILILVGTAFAPLGNYFQQKARKEISSETMMFLRSLMSAPMILLLAYLLGNSISPATLRPVWVAVAINGFVLFGLSKIFWIEGIHRISVTKADAMSGFEPLLTLLLAWAILGTVPTIFQLLSFVPLFFGMLLLTYRKKDTAPA
jgi:drug/metabolite transporter (DMT)-like permease